MKYRWRVGEEPKGQYKSFDSRPWPMAIYEDGTTAASISCSNDYVPREVKTGNHAELRLLVADHSVTPWVWRSLKTRFATLKQAKDALTRFLKKNPHYIPKEKT